MKIQGVECHGLGGEVDSILDDGSGPFYECWLCFGEGEIETSQRGIWLTYKRLDKREKNQGAL